MSEETGTLSRLQRLLRFVDLDADNLQLIADAAETAFDEGEMSTVTDLLDRYQAKTQLPRALLNLRGLVALRTARISDARAAFAALVAQGEDNPSVRFNLGWSMAVEGDFEGTLSVLDSATTRQLPDAAVLEITSLHNLGRLDEALEAGKALLQQHPRNAELAGALSAVAIDAEDLPLAKAYGVHAGDNPDGLATIGMLSLRDNAVQPALVLFEQAIARKPDSARGHLGAGLALMASGDAQAAAPHIDRAAEVFSSHLGSWVAAGWAYFTLGDYATSRARFETALRIDDTFAETHGGLAVLDIIEGHFDSAQRRMETSLRLDRRCLAGALAKSLLLQRAGDVSGAQRVQSLALNTAIGPDGETIAQAAVRMGMVTPGRR